MKSVFLSCQTTAPLGRSGCQPQTLLPGREIDQAASKLGRWPRPTKSGGLSLRASNPELANGRIVIHTDGNVRGTSPMLDVWPPVAEPLEAHIVGWRDGGEACQLPEDAAKWMVRAKNSGSRMSYAWIAIGNCLLQRAYMRGKLVSHANPAATRRLGSTNFCEN